MATKAIREQRLGNQTPGMRLAGLALGLAFLSAMPAAARDLPAVKPVLDCSALAKIVLANPEAPGRVESAAVVTTGTPSPYCDVKGYVTPQVRFELHLPTVNWTQRLLFEGCGGFCGAIRLGAVRAAEGCQPVTNGEFILVTSDLGHASQGMDAVWAADKQLRVDFGYRGVHVTTLAAKEIVARFYGRPQAFAYFNGCSDGGREAMVEVERYPADYNGVVSGASVVNETANNTIFHAWALQHVQHPDGSNVFSDAALTMLHNAAVAACGEKDGLIGDPEQCHFDPGSTACKGGEAVDSCLTPEQVRAARDIYIGAQGPDGRAIYFGYPIGSELGWNRQVAGVAGWRVGSFPGYLASDPPSLTAEMSNVAFTPEAVKKLNVFGADLNALNPDIRPFQSAGGKLIMWHGWADPAVPSMSSVTFFRAIRGKAGAATDAFVRLYMLPGVGHCGGGQGPDKADLMTAIMAWTEDGIAPGAITVNKKDGTGPVTATRTIQPFR